MPDLSTVVAMADQAKASATVEDKPPGGTHELPAGTDVVPMGGGGGMMPPPPPFSPPSTSPPTMLPPTSFPPAGGGGLGFAGDLPALPPELLSLPSWMQTALQSVAGGLMTQAPGVVADVWGWLRDRVGGGILRRPECMFLYETLPMPARDALAAYWCGLTAPIGLSKAAEAYFLTILLSQHRPPNDGCCYTPSRRGGE